MTQENFQKLKDSFFAHISVTNLLLAELLNNGSVDREKLLESAEKAKKTMSEGETGYFDAFLLAVRSGKKHLSFEDFQSPQRGLFDFD